jgi:hypothetical protein
LASTAGSGGSALSTDKCQSKDSRRRKSNTIGRLIPTSYPCKRQWKFTNCQSHFPQEKYSLTDQIRKSSLKSPLKLPKDGGEGSIEVRLSIRWMKL